MDIVIDVALRYLIRFNVGIIMIHKIFMKIFTTLDRFDKEEIVRLIKIIVAGLVRHEIFTTIRKN